jgi:hypothetical protein
MKRQIFISILIVAFFNFINGCSVTQSEKIIPQQLTFEKDVIQEAVLTNFDVVKFDQDGGQYTRKPDFIEGTLLDGKKVKIPIDEIDEFRISNVDPVKIEDLMNRKVKEILLKNDVLAMFDNNGGLYNEKENQISGILRDSKEKVNISVDRILDLYLESPKTINESELKLNRDIRIAQVLWKSNHLLQKFNEVGGKFMAGKSLIIGKSENNQNIVLDPDSVLYVNVERTNVAGSILASLGLTILILAGVVLIIAATKQSCPFIYSYDGNKYVFDAEPLGGATTKGLERTEYSKLDYLKKLDGSYKILARNEVEETQFIDELSLLAVTHDSDKYVIPDLDGNFYQIKDPIRPFYAEDEKGTDLRKVVYKNDNLYWQSKLPIDSSIVSKNQRHELIFKFFRPKGVLNAKLIANIGTSLWGSRMIREMLQLYGNQVDNYYERIDEKGFEYKQMMQFIENEELYKLKYYTKSNNDWTLQGFINGGGPLISETRAYNLDLSKIDGDTVTIRVCPPYGFWTINYLAVQYENFPSPKIKNIHLSKAINQNGDDITELIKSKDKEYCIMPNVGDFLEATYNNDKDEISGGITFYLRSTGYYEIHLNKSVPIQFSTLSKFITEPGYIVKYANQRYKEWQILNN